MTGSAAPREIRLLLVDDDPLVRSGLRMLFGGTPSLRIVAEAEDGADVPGLLDLHTIDVVLMDLRMPRVDGIAATRQVRARANAPRVLVLTTFDDDELLYGALEAGADGFLLKHTSPEEIVAAIEAVHAGDAVLSPSVTRRLMERVTAGAARPASERSVIVARLATLSGRELDVARAIAQGRSNAQIATDLHMSVATVKAHVTRLFAKLDVDNRVQLALLVHDADRDGRGAGLNAPG
jgi:DNA-binding NarL/FixJ family response regulator